MGICRGCRSRCRSLGVRRGCLILAVLVLHSQLSTKRLGKVVRACHAQAAPVAVELEGLCQGDVHIRVACQVACLCTKVGRRLVGACLFGFQQTHPSQDEGARMAEHEFLGTAHCQGDAARGVLGEGAAQGACRFEWVVGNDDDVAGGDSVDVHELADLTCEQLAFGIASSGQACAQGARGGDMCGITLTEQGVCQLDELGGARRIERGPC